ncbi:MAG: hypothetical protein LUG16_03240 [Candidatus Gastranaerophilales bacterium]|nr:hypothetical protein [Candidatus Gastranaerophilales bacterium]
MFTKKLIYSLCVFFLISQCSYSEEQSLRNMFQNNEAVIYALNIRTFNADDKNGNDIIEFSLGETSGTFINAIERLDELKSLGINTIHLLPITPTGKIKAIGTAGSLYAITDFTSINTQFYDDNSELSLKDQAKKFIQECHNRGMKVIVDLPSCGAYDFFINRPDLFLKDENGDAYIPADWMDVRLFDVPDDHKLFQSDIYVLHKLFVNFVMELGADGIRADVATIKPFIFWKELISYTRTKNKDFLFLAEASESWTQPASEKAYFTDYKKLLEAGFDGYYGDYFDLKNWNTMDKLTESVENRQKILKKYPEKKSVIGSFETHDVISPLLTGGENFSKMIIWLNATLPLNPYYVDGFLQADDYIYQYSNKRASETYTDDSYYYVHQGQIDIFNFSRKPGSESNILVEEHKQAIELRNNFLDSVTMGDFIPLNTNNNRIFAYQRTYKNKSVVVIINRNMVNSEEVKVNIKNIKRKSKINYIKNVQNIKVKNSVYNSKMRAAEIVILTIE